MLCFTSPVVQRTPQVALSLGLSWFQHQLFHKCPKGFPEAPCTAPGPKVFLPATWAQTLLDRDSRYQSLLFITFLCLSSSSACALALGIEGGLKNGASWALFIDPLFLYVFRMNPFLCAYTAWCLVFAFTYPPKEMTFLKWPFFCYTHTCTDKAEVPFSSLKVSHCHEMNLGLFFILMFSDLEVMDHIYVLLIVAFKIFK